MKVYSYSTHIGRNITEVVPQFFGLRFAAKFNNINESSGASINYRIVTKVGDTLNYKPINSAPCTDYDFNSMDYSYMTKITFNDRTLDDVDFSQYVCPSQTDIVFYSNSYGPIARYVEIYVDRCNSTMSS